MKLNFKIVAQTALLILALLAGNIQRAFATHFAAADMFVDYIGADSTNLKYRVTLTVFFACEPGSSTASDSETVTWASQTAGFTKNRWFKAVIKDTIDQLCPNFSQINSCRTTGSTYPGFARRVYVDTLTLPSAQADWLFSWNNSARNSGINNLANPGGQTLYIDAGINNTGKFWGNSTPRYQVLPVPYLCVNQNNNFRSGPIDPDQDSIITFNVQPRGGTTNFLAYNTTTTPPYSLTNPFGSPIPNNYNVNPVTADARFNPPNTGKYVIAFRTEAYDPYTHVRTGYIHRDVQVAILPCSSPPPSIDSVPFNYSGPVLNGNVISICPNVRTSFDIRASSYNLSSYIRLRSDDYQTNAPGSSVIVDTANNVSTAHFTWSPTTADIGTHYVTFIAVDTTCTPGQPILLSNSQTVIIQVKPGLDAGPDQKICPLGDNPVQLNVSGPPNKVYKWYSGTGGTPQYLSNRDIPNPVATPPVDYTYIVRSNDPDFVCKSSDTVVVRVDRSNGVEVMQDPLIVCRPSYVTIGADSIGTGPIKNLPCGTANTVTCTTPTIINIGQPGTSTFFRENTPFYSNHKYHKYQFIISKSELRNAGLYSGTLKSIAFHSNNPTTLAAQPLGAMTVSLSCTDRSTFPNVGTNEAFDINTTVVATMASYTITPNAWNTIQFTSPYNWDTTKNLIVDICMGPYTTVDTNGFDPVDVMPGQTLQRYSDVVDVCSGNAAISDVVKYTQRPIVQFGYCSAPELPFSYHWHPGTYLADSTQRYTTAYVANSMNYAVYTKGKNGCLVRDSLHIIVPVYKLTVDPKDTAVCVNQPAPLHASGATAYIWYENGFNTPTTLSCNDCADPVATPNTPGDVVYTVVFLNPDNCYDTLTQRIHVYALPDVAIVNNDTTIKYGQSVMLMVNGANQYTWTPVGSLNDPNLPNPVATPTQSTTYIVYGIDGHQCRATDSVRVNIDFRDNLLVPTGFTPNGDGRNDYFRVVNMTFQKLMEFRVFNRWGQEVFSTNDPMKGWDGKWKGVDQDMGTYKYLIRVAFPDGYVETYKGDVTLIR